MRLSTLSPFIFLILIFFFISLLQKPIFAAKRSYVVYMGEHSHGPEVSQFDIDRVKESHCNLLSSVLGSTESAKEAIFYSYTRHINGFAAFLEEEEVEAIQKHPKVVSVFLNKGRKLHTTRSWNFLGLEEDSGIIPTNSIWEKATFGEDIIIGNLDTGVWPESKSFSDEGMGPIPSKWKGFCQNNTKDGVPCNRKLIGARYFNEGYKAEAGSESISSFESARDSDGHGTHTLSTAGGSFVSGANVFGLGNGTAKGGSPKARVAAYKVCWPPFKGNEVFDVDLMAGFDAAIHDGVDVLSISLGESSPVDYFQDAMSIGSFHAFKKGIVVVSSAGNSGPKAGTVENISPWMFTVGASTMDREFPTYVTLGNKQHFKGQSLSPVGLPAQKFYPLISSIDAKASNALARDAEQCRNGTLDPKKVKGKIVVCLNGGIEIVAKGQHAALAGAVGMILANNNVPTRNEIFADAHVLPTSHISYTDGFAVMKYINSTKSPMAYMTRPKTQLDTKPAPFMASFSSKGPNTITPGILKPDITAPGVSVIAAFTQAAGPTGLKFDKRRVLFNSASGTSMSCPHISGIVGLLKTIHPDWSPSAIKSAIMTTARTQDNDAQPMLNASYQKATPFSYGAGHVWPNHAMDPGLVYDLTTNDYLNFLCSLGYNGTQIMAFSEGPYKCPKSFSLLNFNYPSITVPSLSSSVTVTRTVRNVGSPGTYKAFIRRPKGISMLVKPNILTFSKVGEEKTFKVTLKVKKAGSTDYVFGTLTWTDGKHQVKSPIVVKAAQG